MRDGSCISKWSFLQGALGKADSLIHLSPKIACQSWPCLIWNMYPKHLYWWLVRSRCLVHGCLNKWLKGVDFLSFSMDNFFLLWFFSRYSWFTVFCQFLWYSKETQLYIHIYIIFLTLSSIMFHHKWLDIVPCAIEQDLIAYPLQMQESASINPRLPVPPTLFSPIPLATTSLFSKSMNFFPVGSFICAIY